MAGRAGGASGRRHLSGPGPRCEPASIGYPESVTPACAHVSPLTLHRRSWPRMPGRLGVWTVAALIAAGGRGQAQPPASAEFFEKKVRPLLVARCLECHGAD